MNFTGSQPNVGTFNVHEFKDTQDAYANLEMVNGEHIEFEVSTVDGYDELYAKLRQHGFTIFGFQTAKVLQFKRAA